MVDRCIDLGGEGIDWKVDVKEWEAGLGDGVGEFDEGMELMQVEMQASWVKPFWLLCDVSDSIFPALSWVKLSNSNSIKLNKKTVVEGTLSSIILITSMLIVSCGITLYHAPYQP